MQSASTQKTLNELAPEVLEDALLVEELVPLEGGGFITGVNLEDAAAGAEVHLPPSTDIPAEIRSNGHKIGITMPKPGNRAKATIGPNKEIQYDNRDGSMTTAIPKEGGSLQFINTLSHGDAPTEYVYKLDLPPQAKMSLTPEGGVQIIGSDGAYLGGATAPWARDVAGNPVATEFKIRGKNIVQEVHHSNLPDSSYPVVADPWFGIHLYYQPFYSFVSQGYKVNVTPTSWGQQNRAFEMWWAHRDEVVSKMGNNAWRWTNSIQEQFYCHIHGYPASLPTYNMESWRPTINWSISLVQYRCNPYDGAWS